MGVNSKWGLILDGGNQLRGYNSIRCIKATVVLASTVIIIELVFTYRYIHREDF